MILAGGVGGSGILFIGWVGSRGWCRSKVGTPAKEHNPEYKYQLTPGIRPYYGGVNARVAPRARARARARDPDACMQHERRARPYWPG
eukprot:COSAG02_NODE_536_length_20657_cov_91.744041_3_plen_88_part_00